jgi:DNA repair photolyase
VITKHDGLPIKKILSLGKPVILHFTVTTLGNTKWEKGVMKWQDMIERIGDLIKQGLDPEFITLRIDPIIPGVTKINEVERLIKRASELGIKHVRFSILDYYKSTAPDMIKLGFDYSKYFDPDGTGGFKRNARDDYRQGVATTIKAMTDKYGMDLSTCAEGSLIPGVKKEGCLSPHAINEILGTHIADKEELNNNSRELCTCYGGKQDILSYNVNCASVCTYCYAHHGSDRMVEYYDEDGTLKDNDLTRTTKGRAFATQNTEHKEVLDSDQQEGNKQSDLFKELGISEDDMKKAEEVKNHCKGGK